MALRKRGLATRQTADGVWVSGTVLTDPADGDVLVDTAALADAGNYLVAIVGSASVAIVYDVQHRNAANGANNDSQRRRPASGDFELIFPNDIAIAASERLRVVNVGAVTGTVQVSIFYKQIPS